MDCFARRCGFTLIELLFVLVIVSIICMFSLPAFDGAFKKSRINDAKSQLLTLQVYLDRFYIDNAFYPDKLDSLPVFSSLKLAQHENYEFSLENDTKGCSMNHCYMLVAFPRHQDRKDELLKISSNGYKLGPW